MSRTGLRGRSTPNGAPPRCLKLPGAPLPCPPALRRWREGV